MKFFSLTDWLKRKRLRVSRPQQSRWRRFQPWMEVLENRITPATLFVDQAHIDCDNGGIGTPEHPYCTIAAAAADAQAGDTVQVATGVYNEQITVPNTGTAGNPIIFESAPGASVVVTGGSNGFRITNKDYITIRGFTITETISVGIRVSDSSNIVIVGNELSFAGEPVSGQTASGILITNTTDSTIADNVVHHNTNSGILVSTNSNNNLITGNHSFANAREFTRAAAGIDIRGSNNIISANVTYDNEDTGIQIFSSASNPNEAANNLIVNNITYNNGDHGIDVLRSEGQRIIGNTVYNNTTAGIDVEGNSSFATIANNIAVDNGIGSTATRGNIRVDGTSMTGTTVDHDLVFIRDDAPAGTIIMSWGTVGYTTIEAFQAASGQEANVIVADPRFVDAANGDFHLHHLSPAIDSADSSVSGHASSDAESNPRVDSPLIDNTGVGPRVFDDRGALEYQPSILYVDQTHANADDDGPGTADQPFATISAAEDVAQPGDIVLVSQGTYSECVRIDSSGTEADPIFFLAQNGETVTVTGGQNGFRIEGQTWITISGFHITETSSYGLRVRDSSHIIVENNDVSFAGSPEKGETAKGIYFSNTTDSRIANNTVHHNSDSGIYLTNGSDRNQVIGNTSFDNARGYTRAANGIEIYAGNENLLFGNITFDNEDSGILLRKNSANNTVANNISYGNGDHGIDVHQSTGNNIISNTVYGNATEGVIVQGGSINTTVANNIIADNGLNDPTSKGDLVVDSDSIAGTTSDFNLLFSSSTDPTKPLVTWGDVDFATLDDFAAATGMEAKGIEADPLFVDAAAGDFHLQSSSAAIDSANSGVVGHSDTDAEGNARVDDPDIVNTGVGPRTFDDRGALEFQALDDFFAQ